MKKLYSSLFLLSLAISAGAQQPQLPNSGFEENWGDCTPWTSDGNTKTQGTTPGNWTISQVIGIGGTGATAVGEKAEGYESESAVKVANTPNAFLTSQIVPGYVTLGTTWSTSVLGKENDGGTFGGHAFVGRPEKITFMYKFERETENTEPANAIVYLWKGTYTQAAVPGNIVIFGSPKTVDMVNRDRNILGIETTKGGEVTKSEGAELIAKGTLVITETTTGWTEGEVVLEYLSDATPEMINVIFSANDYFKSTGITKGNALTVDNVYCVYPEEPAGEVLEFPGKLNVSMNGMDLAKDSPSTIEITPNADFTECTFLLPNLDLGNLGNFGDIKVNNVKMTKDGDVTTFAGGPTELSLAEGNILAAVTVNGTCDATGKLDMKIDVAWHAESGDMPIDVTFTGAGKPVTGIGSIEADSAAPVEYYNIQGIRIAPEALTPGLYIRRQGDKTTKVVIK